MNQNNFFPIKIYLFSCTGVTFQSLKPIYASFVPNSKQGRIKKTTELDHRLYRSSATCFTMVYNALILSEFIHMLTGAKAILHDKSNKAHASA